MLARRLLGNDRGGQVLLALLAVAVVVVPLLNLARSRWISSGATSAS
jgi:hypothetical protein